MDQFGTCREWKPRISEYPTDNKAGVLTQAFYSFQMGDALRGSTAIQRLWKTKRPTTDHMLREDCGYQLLYTKQLNREQYEGPVNSSRTSHTFPDMDLRSASQERQALCSPVVHTPNLARRKRHSDQRALRRGPFLLLPLSQGQSAVLWSVTQVEAQQGAFCRGGQRSEV
ncbi:hypothetical protein EYF80_023186 [Liparis tanakae]|uniref:Uncharacterized protein n=1 Tax=Liparis tanakae TaxID=230148 RepID=A0A4Z2HPE6_9TELE|nr:hypothetical protein EYF80_023186 [Liparis tanakae]